MKKISMPTLSGIIEAAIAKFGKKDPSTSPIKNGVKIRLNAPEAFINKNNESYTVPAGDWVLRKSSKPSGRGGKGNIEFFEIVGSNGIGAPAAYFEELIYQKIVTIIK